MNTIELRTQLLALEAERLAALAWGLADLPAYRAATSSRTSR